MDDKIYKVTKLAELANVTRRLIFQVKDHNADIISINKRLRTLLSQMENEDGVIILADEEGNQFIGLMDLLDTENEKDDLDEVKDQKQDNSSDDEWIDIEDLDDTIETWQQFNDVFGDELTNVAKDLMKDMVELTNSMDENIKLMQNIQENMEELFQIVRDGLGQNILTLDSGAIEETLINIQNGIYSGQKCLQDLKTIRKIFPMHELMTPDEYKHFREKENRSNSPENVESRIPQEECRPFPDAWL